MFSSPRRRLWTTRKPLKPLMILKLLLGHVNMPCQPMEWGGKYPSIAPSWRRAWQEVIPFFAFPPAVRKIIYTTNAIESLNRVIRKTTKTRGSFPTDDAATKLIYLAIRKFEKSGRCVREWPLSDASIACRLTGCRAKLIRYPIPPLSGMKPCSAVQWNGSITDPF